MFQVDRDSYLYRSTLIIPVAYERVQDVVPQFGISQGFLTATEFGLTDVLCVLCVFLSVMGLILRVREQQMTLLLRSMSKGRCVLALHTPIYIIA